MEVTLTRITDEPILAVEEAASNCYDSEPSNEGKIMKSCIRSGHTSVTEFCNFTFHIEGVSRTLLAQLTRHRHSSFAVQSQRYVDKNNFNYITPPSIKKNKEANKAYDDFMNTAKAYYSTLKKCNIDKEDARYVLPNACDTVIEVSMNFRALMNFMNLRLCERSQWEIRDLAIAMKKAVVEKFPEAEPYLVPKCEVNGKDKAFCTEHKCCGRHPKLKDVFNGYNFCKEYLKKQNEKEHKEKSNE